ncbi:hypothetical protein SDC9_173507 [bioreactor metagenome]|uniref:Uncharacterized protein n=1 Tax=bioreactor metagenome TaxID=1076179 RepID=A0A645GHB8_9ZZZZ
MSPPYACVSACIASGASLEACGAGSAARSAALICSFTSRKTFPANSSAASGCSGKTGGAPSAICGSPSSKGFFSAAIPLSRASFFSGIGTAAFCCGGASALCGSAGFTSAPVSPPVCTQTGMPAVCGFSVSPASFSCFSPRVSRTVCPSFPRSAPSGFLPSFASRSRSANSPVSLPACVFASAGACAPCTVTAFTSIKITPFPLKVVSSRRHFHGNLGREFRVHCR